MQDDQQYTINTPTHQSSYKLEQSSIHLYNPPIVVLNNTAIFFFKKRSETVLEFVYHLGFQTRKDLSAFHIQPFYYY